MAFAVTARQSTNGGQTSAQTRATGSATPTASSLFLAFFGSGNDNHTTAPVAQTPVGGGWTYTQRALSGYSTAYEWNGTTGYRVSQALYTAPIGGSPGAHTVTFDNYSGTNVGFYSGICCDVTGHDPSGTPLYYTNGANVATAADNVAGTVTLGATPAVGSLVVVSFYAGSDSGGTMSTPTLGGRTMLPITVQTNSGYTLQGAWCLVINGSESSNVITCPDLGTQTGCWTAIAAVIPAAAGGGSISGTAVAALAALTATAAGLRAVIATAVASLGTLTATAAGLRAAAGSGAASLPAPTAAAAGLRTVLGTATVSLPGLTASAAGARLMTGTAAAALPSVAATASGLRDSSGSGAASLPTVSASAAGTRSTAGAGVSTLPALVAQAVAAVEIAGQGSATPGGVQAVATGLRSGHGSGAAVLGGLSAAASGTVAGQPIANAALPAVVATATGLRASHGAGAAALPGLIVVGSGTRSLAGTGAAILGAVLALIEVPELSNGVSPDDGAEWLTLGDLMSARSDQESIQFDVIRIRHDEHAEGEFDPGLGYAPTEMPEPFYGPGIEPHNGKARVQAKPVQSGDRTSGMQVITVLGYAVAIPWDVIDVRPTDIIEVVEAEYEPMHAGKVLRVADVQSSTFVTARRMSCVDYQRRTPS
jgi:hypothetical protein